MIKEKTLENIEDSQTRQTQDKFIPNSCFGQSSKMIEKWIDQFVHQEVHVFNKKYFIDCRWYMYLHHKT